eukprot:CAMPEP_0181410306 /NCGR_PEP_ID=MMETSP1110-20121109/7268_1 /TAXON_ID=174948 /ORGANISM="Symbiodinium sp., Strain CCMP421" /LENGTH=106 /DNA_ID=CAMNT_0023532843 /DNA_START=134 /DNA_END=451 /DNA_ORIENTATION=-
MRRKTCVAAAFTAIRAPWSVAILSFGTTFLPCGVTLTVTPVLSAMAFCMAPLFPMMSPQEVKGIATWTSTLSSTSRPSFCAICRSASMDASITPARTASTESSCPE